jgi:hypothetical protein
MFISFRQVKSYKLALNNMNNVTLNGTFYETNETSSTSTKTYYRTWTHVSNKEDLNNVEEALRFLSIIGVCLLIIIMTMSLCYFSHVFYSFLKPFIPYFDFYKIQPLFINFILVLFYVVKKELYMPLQKE